MAKKEFYLFKRKGVYYAQFIDPQTGRTKLQKSTGKDNLEEAYMVIADWKRTGFSSVRNNDEHPVKEIVAFDTFLHTIRSKKIDADDLIRLINTLKEAKYIESALVVGSSGTISLIEYQKNFWDYEKSPYIREKLLHGQKLGKYHALDCQHRIHYWEEYFGSDLKIGEVTPKHLRDFSLWLAERQVSGAHNEKQKATFKKRQISPGTINGIMNAGCLPLRWAYLHDEIPIDPAKGLMRFSGEAKKRGILTESEVKKLFSVEWKGERERIASALAMVSGLRSGEVLALRREDIGEDRILVRHSWSVQDGLKCTKTSKERIAPLLPAIRKELIRLVDSNPHDSNGFIFYGLLPDKPMVGNVLLEGLYDAMEKVGIKEKERKERGLCFHSWRHYFTAQLAAKLDARIVQHATGHATTEMLEHYANHELEGQLKTLNQAASEAFGNVVSFEKKTA